MNHVVSLRTYTTAEGKQIRGLANEPHQAATPPLLLCPGFGTPQERLAGLAIAFAESGIPTYRLDPINHAGLSEGGPSHFTLSGVVRSIEAAVDDTIRRADATGVVLCPLSLSTAPAIRVAADDPRVLGCIAISAVGDIGRTLHRATGVDYSSWTYDELPDEASYNGITLTPSIAKADSDQHHWLDLDLAARLTAAVHGPITALHPTADGLVERDELERLLGDDCADPRSIVEIPGAEHDFGNNLEVARAVARIVVEAVYELSGVDASYVEPSIDTLLGAISEERELTQSRRAKGGDLHEQPS